MKKKILPLIFIFSFIFNVVAVVYLLPGRPGKDPAHSHSYHLDHTQKMKIHKESRGFIVENEQLEKELGKCRQELFNLLNSENIDRTKIEECISTISQIQKKIQLNTVEQLLIYKKHMDEEQCRCFLQEFGENMKVLHTCDENCSCTGD